MTAFQNTLQRRNSLLPSGMVCLRINAPLDFFDPFPNTPFNNCFLLSLTEKLSLEKFPLFDDL
jgi:hypothetical protein